MVQTSVSAGAVEIKAAHSVFAKHNLDRCRFIKYIGQLT